VRCWGGNVNGELGGGSAGPAPRLSPPAGDLLTAIQALAVGFSHSCALTESGGVRCWGSNGYGQLGDGSHTDRHAPTGEVITGVAAIAAGTWHTCALLRSGAVRCWGRNDYGQLGDGTQTESAVPVNVPVCP
jgi:alpha-tubulin suppressor-like RCC1 family protein